MEAVRKRRVAQQIKSWRAHKCEITSAIIGQRSSGVVATADYNGEIKVWRIDISEPILRLEDTAGDAITRLLFSDDESMLLFGLDNGAVRVWDLASNTVKKSLSKDDHKGAVSAFSFHPFNSEIIFASGSADFSVRLWKLPVGPSELLSLQKYRGHIKKISSVQFVPNGRVLMSGDISGKVVLWDLQSSESFKSFSLSIPGPVVSMAFHPADSYGILAGSSLETLQFSLESNENVTQDLDPPFITDSPINSAKFSPNGDFLFVSTANSLQIFVYKDCFNVIQTNWGSSSSSIVDIALTPAIFSKPKPNSIDEPVCIAKPNCITLAIDGNKATIYKVVLSEQYPFSKQPDLLDWELSDDDIEEDSLSGNSSPSPISPPLSPSKLKPLEPLPRHASPPRHVSSSPKHVSPPPKAALAIDKARVAAALAAEFSKEVNIVPRKVYPQPAVELFVPQEAEKAFSQPSAELFVPRDYNQKRIPNESFEQKPNNVELFVHPNEEQRRVLQPESKRVSHSSSDKESKSKDVEVSHNDCIRMLNNRIEVFSDLCDCWRKADFNGLIYRLKRVTDRQVARDFMNSATIAKHLSLDQAIEIIPLLKSLLEDGHPSLALNPFAVLLHNFRERIVDNTSSSSKRIGVDVEQEDRIKRYEKLRQGFLSLKKVMAPFASDPIYSTEAGEILALITTISY